MNLSRALPLLLLILIGLSQLAFGQSRTGRTRTIPAKPAAPQPSPRGGNADKYWAAQSSIEAAIQQLEAYLEESPDGERAATARQQIAVLRSLTLTVSKPEWTSMNQRRPLRDVPDWRVAALYRQPGKTRASVEITCKRDDGGNCYFAPFDRHPLVLIDNAGRYFPMLESETLPSDIRFTDDGQATLSGGRTITIAVDFAPLAPATVSGQIYYRDNNQANPAQFSLTPRR